MAIKKKDNIFQRLFEAVKSGLNSPVARVIPAVAAYQAVKKPGIVQNTIKTAGREIYNAMKPLGTSIGETIAYNTPSVKKNIAASRNSILQSQQRLIQKAAQVSDPVQKRRLLKLASDMNKTGQDIIQKTTPTYTPKQIISSGAQTAALTVGGPKVFTKAGASALGINSVFSGLLNKITGGSFSEGAGRGAAVTPQILAVLGATDPLLYKLVPQAGKFIPRISSAVANVGQGKVIDISTGQKTTPQSLALDLVTGFLGGRGQFRPTATSSKFAMDKLTFDELIKAEEMFRNPKKFLSEVELGRHATKKGLQLAEKQALDTVRNNARETIERLGAKYLPNEVFYKVTGDLNKTVKALVDLNSQNRLANVPGMGFVNKGTRATKAKMKTLEQEIADEVAVLEGKAQVAGATREPFSDNFLKDVNLLKRLQNVSKYAEGDIETLRASKHGPAVERVVQGVREERPDITGDEEALRFALEMPTKAETKVSRSEKLPELKALEKQAVIEQRGIVEGRRLERESLKRERLAKQKTKAEEIIFNRELAESGGARPEVTQKEYMEQFRKEVAPVGKQGFEKIEKDNERLRHLITYNDTLRRMGYTQKQVNRIGFVEAEKIIRDRIAPQHQFDPLPTNVAKDLQDTQRAVEGPKPQTPVEKKVNILDLFRTPDRVLEKMGLGKEARFLRFQYENYLKELPDEINKVTEWSKRIPDERKVDLFRYLDGRPQEMSAPLSRVEFDVANEMKAYLKKWASKLNLPEDKQISHYITHIFEPDFIAKEFDEDLAKVISGKVPGSVYDPFLQKRLGALGYIEDPWRAMDAYIKRAVRKYNMDPVLKQLQHKAEDLELSQADYVLNLTERINMRPTKVDNMIDNFVKSIPVVGYKLGQRPVANVSRGLRQAVYRGTLGLNVGTAVKNLMQGVNTYAKLGEKYTVVGYAKALKDLVFRSDELERTGVLRDQFIQDRQLSGVKKFWDKVDPVLFAFFETAERINRGAAYFGAKAKALNAGATEAVAEATGRDLARQTQFTFGSVDTPPILQADINKSLLQFQSYSIKQAEFIGEMIQHKEWGGMIRWLGANIALLALVGDAIGMDLKSLIPTVRVGGTPSMQLATGVGQLVFDSESEKEQAKGNIGKAILAHIPGGVQAKKTIEGLVATSKKGVFTENGSLKFPVADEAFFNAVFGPNRGKGASFYFDNQLSPLGKEDTMLWQLGVSRGQDPYKAWAIVYRKRIIENIPNKVSEIIKKPGLSVEEKKVEAQKIIDEGKTLINKLDSFANINEVMPVIPATEEPSPSKDTTLLRKESGNTTGKSLAFSGKLKVGKPKVAKPTLQKRAFRIKKTKTVTQQRFAPVKVFKPANERRYAIA